MRSITAIAIHSQQRCTGGIGTIRASLALERKTLKMRWDHCEPTFEEILSDPIFVALMRADRVGPHELEAMLKRVAAVSRSIREADRRAMREPHSRSSAMSCRQER